MSDKTMSALREVSQQVQDVSGFIGEIAANSEHQSEAVQQVSEGAVSLDRQTQSGAASARRRAPPRSSPTKPPACRTS